MVKWSLSMLYKDTKSIMQKYGSNSVCHQEIYSLGKEINQMHATCNNNERTTGLGLHKRKSPPNI